MKNVFRKAFSVLLCVLTVFTAVGGLFCQLALQAAAYGEEIGMTSNEGYCQTAQASTTQQAMAIYNKITTKQARPEIAQRVHDLIFKSTYCVTDFGGKHWPKDNTGSGINSMYDPGLGTTVKWRGTTWGCFSYAMFCSQYIRNNDGRDGIRYLGKGKVPTAAQLKSFVLTYMDVGEHLHYLYKYGTRLSQHSICYIGCDNEGVYFLSNNVSTGIRLYYSTYTFLVSRMRVDKNYSHVVWMYDTNNGRENLPFLGIDQDAEIHEDGHVYTLFTGADSYQEAADFAAASGGYLATVSTLKEQGIINTLLRDSKCEFAWIGLQSRDGEQTWTTGEDLLYRYYYTDGEDAQGNGLLFTDKLENGALTGMWTASDGDYAYNGQTYTAKNFAFIVETGALRQTVVTLADEITANGRIYRVYESNLDCQQMQTYCAQQGGYPVCIGSTEELETVRSLQLSTNGMYRTGGYGTASGTLAWQDASEIDEALQLPAVANGAHLVLYASGNGQTGWMTGGCNDGIGFICEIPLPGVRKGDANMDDRIAADDARIALRYSVRLEEESETLVRLCDIDADGVVSADDARMILRASVRLEDSSAWGTVYIEE